jgi:hypothetical protein
MMLLVLSLARKCDEKNISETSGNALNMENKGIQKDIGKGSGNHENSWKVISVSTR